MDKYEYQLKTEHIRQVAARKEYGEAAKLCDTIDWTKIRDVKMLTLAADVYTAVGEYEKAIDILQQAYEYAAMGRRIVYRLTELALKADSYDDAKNYFEEFCRIAPNDQGRYILLYKMARYQKATLDEKIKILEAYKREDFDEKWAYELAVLYAMNNEKDKCIQLCDDIILWFGLGKYVEKALSLKSQFAPLTQAQKEKAQKFADKKAQEENEKLQKKQEEQEKKESQAELAKKAAAQEKISKWQEKAYQAEQEAAKKEAKAREEEQKALLEREEKLRKQREEELEAVERLKKAQRLEHARQSVVTSDMNEIMAVIQRAKQEDAQNELQDELAKQVQQVQQLAGEKDLELVSEIPSDVEDVEGEEKLQVPEELSYIQDETLENEISENETLDTETANTETVNTETAEKTSDRENADETVWFEAYHPEEEPQISEWAAPVAETVEVEPEEEVQEEIQEEPEKEPEEEPQEAEVQEESEGEPEEESQEELEKEPEEEEPQEEFEEEPEEKEPKEEIQEEPEEEEPEEEVQEESEEEPEEEIQEEPEEKPEQESAESRQVEMTANGGLPIVNPEDMSRVWHFAIQAMLDEDDIELALEYLEELAERSSRAVPRSVVKITGQKLNQKGLVKSIDKLLGKTILIEDAADMNERVINEFCKIIDPTDRSLLVVFIDTPASIRHLLIDYPQLAQVVTAQFVRETYSVTELLEYARGYADREDSVFDKSGELALMERLKVIAGNQERNKKRIVEMIVNNAIEKAEKKSMRKLFQSKYDKRGCLILRDKDFEVG